MTVSEVDISSRRLTHMRQLEAESIHIMREVVAECERPVMLYSVGKDSSVLVQLARKAFAPGPLPFPLLLCTPSCPRLKEKTYCSAW